MTSRRTASLLKRPLIVKLILFSILGSGFLVGWSWNNQKSIKANSAYAGFESCGNTRVAANLPQPQQSAQISDSRNKSLTPSVQSIVEVISSSGIARNGPSEDHTRLTPLPKGTRDSVIEKKGDWLRLNYGAWISKEETKGLADTTATQTVISSLECRKEAEKTEVVFPLQVPVPMQVIQGGKTLSVTLHNTIAKHPHNLIANLDGDAVLHSIIGQQLDGEQVKYTFNLKNSQQWGYKLRYEGSNLILTLRHPPKINTDFLAQPLSNTTIVIDPGHGGMDTGAIHGNYKEKEIALTISKQLREELELRGARVLMTREEDKELSLAERVAFVNQNEPTLSVSIHYNSIPEDAIAENNKGFASYWYQDQARGLAEFLHKYTVEKLGRRPRGVYWQNLSLARPTVAPSVLLELGFMSHPQELQWSVDPYSQQQLAIVLADGIVEWLKKSR